LNAKKDKIEELAVRLLEKETLSLPDIVEILGPRPFPMKANILEYLDELRERDREDEEIKIKEEEDAKNLADSAKFEEEIEESK
jgi:AFG3 family protein